jgi:hypothetical protein
MHALRTLTFAALAAAAVSAAPAYRLTEGTLIGLDAQGRPRAQCPLRHTDVQAEITGFLARVTVTQEFANPFQDKIEAVYTFPLSQNAAVDDMTMLVGSRVVKGTIKLREEARAIYEAARAAGHVAGLLDQERPNIFTQSVANIMPGEQVKITISYVETLKYEEGAYEFSFPMVVGPRYVPGGRVPDAARITPPVTPQGTRAGHDISISVMLDAGIPLDTLESPAHDVSIERPSLHQRDGPGGYAQGTGVCARHLGVDVRLPHRKGEGDHAPGARSDVPAGHLQPHYVLRRHAHSVPGARACYTR